MAVARLTEGSTLDGFLIGPLIHQGGMAMLWEVTRPDIDFPMLMKVPILFEGEDAAAIVSFEMEQMIMPRLSGPHVPRFVATGDFSTQPYLVMERVPGGSLFPRLAHLPLPWTEVVDLAARVALALDDLHRQHVVHLDIKPSNILFRPDGAAVLIDYGLSHHDQLPDLMAEEFHLPYGTAPYMAPEQVLGERGEPRSDLFALGVLMYFFVTGERPFGDPQRLSGLKKRIWRDPVPPRKLCPELPPWVQEVILRCLEVVPARRHPSAAQLAFDLTHPDQIALTARAEKLRQDGFFAALRRRSDPPDIGRSRRQAVADHLADAPIIAVAVDLNEEDEALARALQDTAARIRATLPQARIACLNVLLHSRFGLDQSLDYSGNNKHALRLAELRHWARPMNLPDGAVTFHVIEATDPAEGLLDYIRYNPVDHVVMGARSSGALRNLIGSVAGALAAQSPCTVTVVRRRRARAEAEG